MAGELARIGHPMLATLLTVSLTSVAQAEPPLPEPIDVKQDAGLMHELELIKEEADCASACAPQPTQPIDPDARVAPEKNPDHPPPAPQSHPEDFQAPERLQ